MSISCQLQQRRVAKVARRVYLVNTFSHIQQQESICMMNADQVRSALADRKPRVVAQQTGLHYYTVLRVMAGRQPSYTTIKALADYLEKAKKELF